jgi:hypothetical protein
VNIESAGDCWIAVYLDRHRGAFHGTNPEPGWQYSATLARPSPQPSHDGDDNNDQPGRRRAQSRKSCRWQRSCTVRGRNRSGSVAGGGLSLRPQRIVRVVPGRRPVIGRRIWSSRHSDERRVPCPALGHRASSDNAGHDVLGSSPRPPSPTGSWIGSAHNRSLTSIGT